MQQEKREKIRDRTLKNFIKEVTKEFEKIKCSDIEFFYNENSFIMEFVKDKEPYSIIILDKAENEEFNLLETENKKEWFLYNKLNHELFKFLCESENI